MTDDKWRGENRTETMRLYMRKKREERKKLGLCVMCGSRPAAEGYVNCRKCLEARKNRGKS